MTRRRRSQLGLVLAGGVVILAGVAIGLAELLRYPKGSVWVIVAAAALLIAAIMKLRGSS
jgi:hypothetical protein